MTAIRIAAVSSNARLGRAFAPSHESPCGSHSLSLATAHRYRQLALTEVTHTCGLSSRFSRCTQRRPATLVELSNML